MKKLFGWIAASSEKHPWYVLLTVLAITVFLVFGILQLETEFSQEGMLPEDAPSVIALERFQDEFGGLNSETVLIEADNVVTPEISMALLGLNKDTLAKEAGVDNDQILGVSTYLDSFKNQAETNGTGSFTDPSQFSGEGLVQGILGFLSDEQVASLVSGQIVKGEGGNYPATIVSITLNPDMSMSTMIDAADGFNAYFGKLLKGTGATFRMAGSTAMAHDSQKMMGGQTTLLFGLAFFFIMLILYLTLRRFSDVFLLLGVILLGIIWVLGLMGWIGIAYTMMSVSVLPLMLGINIAYVIHVISRYYEEREYGGNIYESINKAVRTVGVAVFLTATTTLFGFASFTITDLPPMRDYGFVCMFGIAFCFILSITLLPAAIVVRDKRKSPEALDAHLEKMKRLRRESRWGNAVDKGLTNLAVTAVHRFRIVFPVVILLIGFAVFCIFNVNTGADIRSMMPDDMDSVIAAEDVANYFGAQEQDIILITSENGDILTAKGVANIFALEDGIVSDPLNLPDAKDFFKRDSISSVADLIYSSWLTQSVMLSSGNGITEEAASQAVLTLTPEEKAAFISQLTDDGVDQVIAGLRSHDLFRSMVDSMVVFDENGKATSVVVAVFSETSESQANTSDKAKILIDASAGFSKTTGFEASATGLNVLIDDLLGNIVPTQLRTTALALVLCVLILMIIFRSVMYGMVTLIVVVFGITFEMIWLWALGWPLDIMTVTVTSIIIGAGIDFGIHITHRFREQREGQEDDLSTLEESIAFTVKHMGRSIVAGGITTIGVFAILGASTMEPMRHFGWTVSIGLFGALLAALLVLPSILVRLYRFRHRKPANSGNNNS